MRLTPSTRNSLFWLLFILNLAGVFWGFIFFYGEQFAQTTPALWPFLPDCPLFALLFALALISLKARISSNLFSFFVFAGSLKYGFWTVFVLSAYTHFYYQTPFQSFLSIALIIAHIWMCLQVFLLASLIKVKSWHLAPVLGFFLLSDYSDYVWLTHPIAPQSALPFLFPFTIALTLLATFGGYWVLKNAKRPLLRIV
ncbi:hypothetical protein DRN67_00735 [Candidatus Micrarchaeota archaeon]|nr:MAG: hypothetical protein DRN67_00735 [Candidatus Micrarchaeota archaeon]